MSKTGDNKEKSMAKVIKFINQYSGDWIQKAFAGDKHLIDHFQSKWDSLSKGKNSSYEAMVSLMTQMDAENENKLMKYIDETFAKGGSVASAGKKVGFWDRLFGGSKKKYGKYQVSYVDHLGYTKRDFYDDKATAERVFEARKKDSSWVAFDEWVGAGEPELYGDWKDLDYNKGIAEFEKGGKAGTKKKMGHGEEILRNLIDRQLIKDSDEANDAFVESEEAISNGDEEACYYAIRNLYENDFIKDPQGDHMEEIKEYLEENKDKYKYAKGGKAGKEKPPVPKAIKKRLEELRKELRAERISYGELAELQSLKEYIDPSDVELLEASGVPEFPDDEMAKGGEVGKIASKFKPVVAKHEGDAKEGYSVLVKDKNSNFSAWVDVYISGDDVSTDWNKYIFNLKDSKDVKQKALQENTDIFDMATSEATDYLEKKGLIHQDDKGWHYGKSGKSSGGSMATGGKAGNKKYILESYSGDVVEDDFEEGESTETYHDFHVEVGKTYDSKSELIKAMNEIIGEDYKEGEFDWETGEGKNIQTDVTVSFDAQGNFFPASKTEKSEWKKGKKKLYNAHYFFHVIPVYEANEYDKGGVIAKLFSSSGEINWLITG